MSNSSRSSTYRKIYVAASFVVSAVLLWVGIQLVWRLGAPVEIDHLDAAKLRYEYLFAYENTPFEFAQGLLLLVVAYAYSVAAFRSSGSQRLFFGGWAAFFLFFFLEDFDWLCGFSLHSVFLPTMVLAGVFGLYLGWEALLGARRIYSRNWTALDLLRLSFPLFVLLPNWWILPANKMSAAQFYVSLFAVFLSVGELFFEAGATKTPDATLPGSSASSS